MAYVSVLIVDKSEIAIGLMINVGFVLGLSASKLMPPDTFGTDAVDGDGVMHPALTCIGHIVREAGQNKLRTLRSEFSNSDGVYVTDYTAAAMPSSYDQYTDTLRQQSGEAIKYIAIHVYGPEEIVVPKTKNLSLR